jgi:hypothetical protein
MNKNNAAAPEGQYIYEKNIAPEGHNIYKDNK